MDLRALENRFRTLSGDHGQPPLFTQSEVYDWANEAEREAAERGRLLADHTTEDVVQVALIAGQREYILHPKVIDVESARIQRPGSNGGTRPLCIATLDDMRWGIENRPNLSGWADAFYIYGEPSGDGFDGIHLVLDRKPEQNGGILFMHVYRYPLLDMEAPDDEPEISPRHHDGLIDWMLHRAYSTRDMEGSASARADRHAAAFEARFGVRRNANVTRKQRRHRPSVVKPLRW